MPRPRWTKEEFARLLQVGQAPVTEIAAQFPHRSVNAVLHIRKAVHYYHRTSVNRALSVMQRCYLDTRAGSLTCPFCGMRI